MGRQIDKITLRGFKSIRDLEDFPLKNLNILIGANGAGKSNFTEQIHAHLHFDVNAYEFILQPTTGDTFVYADERILYDGDPPRTFPVDRSIGSGHNESALKEQLRDDKNGTISGFICRSISHWIVYHVHDTSDTAVMRRSCSIRDNEYLRPDGANLAAFLRVLHNEHPNVYEKIRDTIRLATPFFDDFRFRPRPSKGDKMVQLEWTQKDSDYPFHASQLSDGTLRFIALTTALLQPNPPATILVDEPELGLHPYALNLFAGLVKKAATRTQVIVSTQSAPLLDNFEAEDIIVVERKEGASTFERLSSDKLEEWLKDYSLGELWQKNVIGGRPCDD